MFPYIVVIHEGIIKIAMFMKFCVSSLIHKRNEPVKVTIEGCVNCFFKINQSLFTSKRS